MIDTIDFQQVMKEIKEELLYDNLVDEYPSEKETVDLIFNILTEIKISSKKTTRVNGQNLATEMVQNMLSSLDFVHIEYVLDSLKKNTTEIKNMKAYLTTSLYNAPLTYDSYIEAQVNHDMAQPSFYQSSCLQKELNPPVPTSSAPTQIVQEEKTPPQNEKMSSNKSIAKENIFVLPTLNQTAVEEIEMVELPEKHLRVLASVALSIGDIKDKSTKERFIKQLDKEVPSWRKSKNSNAKRLQDKLLSA